MVKASLIRKLENIEDPTIRDVLISFLEEAERIIGETITRKEFIEFVEKTNENFQRVWEAIGKLTEAQERTEERLNELTERVNSLAEAQKRTEEKLEKLIGEHKKTREQLGGLSNAFGYTLEDRAIKGLPKILKEKFNISITEPLRRDHIEVGKNKYVEVNLIGRGKTDGKELMILGECKVQLRKQDIEKFMNRLKMLDNFLPGEKFVVFVTYQTTPQVKKFVSEKGVNLIYSYELPL